MSRSERLTDVGPARKVGETDLAIKIDDGAVSAWVAKQHVEDNGDGSFTMPLWVAEEKGFV